MLLHRIITALIIAGLLLALLFYVPAIFFNLVILAIAAVAAWEWANLANLQSMYSRMLFVFGVMLSLVLALNQLNYLQSIDRLFFPQWSLSDIGFFNLAGIVWAFIFLWLLSYPASLTFWKSRVVRLILGVLVLSAFFVAVVALHQLPLGEFMIVYLLVLIAAADVGAYFSGKRWGKRKLMPTVSPGKTWEGLIGGLLLASVVSVFMIYRRWTFELSAQAFFCVSLIVVVASILGDLFESMLKRYRGIKDSSNLLPGHGGVLDRIDSHLPAIPIFYLLYLLL